MATWITLIASSYVLGWGITVLTIPRLRGSRRHDMLWAIGWPLQVPVMIAVLLVVLYMTLDGWLRRSGV